MARCARLIESTISAFAVLAMTDAAAAQDARWKPSPPDNDWNNPADWDPATVPTGIATFGPSTRTEIGFSERNMAVGKILFEPGAPAYTFILDSGERLRVTGFGIENRSANAATFLLAPPSFSGFPSSDPFYPTVRFEGSSVAGNSRFTIGRLPANNDFSGTGELIFQDTSSAATATITNNFSLRFEGSSTAAASHIANHSAASMVGDATADHATIDNIFGGLILRDRATAAQSSIHNINGGLWFENVSTAGSSHIVNDTSPMSNPSQAGLSLQTSLGVLSTLDDLHTGFTAFTDNSRAGTAAIVSNAGAGSYAPTPRTSGLNVSNSGVTIFYGDSSAENATITNNGGAAGSFLRIAGPRSTPSEHFVEANNAALTFFDNRATAANATIVNNNAAWTVFFDRSSAGVSTITTNSGSTVLLRDQSSGGTARFINNAGGTFDISGLTTAGTEAGSIEGAGTVRLGGKRLTLGGNNRSTEISGVISDGGYSGGAGGSLVKAGTGTLILSGASTYTGATTVSTGRLVVNGSLASAVTVNQGATLGGIGRVGALIVSGTLAPGNSIGTINVAGNAIFAAGSIYEVEADAAGNSDRTLVTGTATLQGGTVAALFQGPLLQCSARYAILTAQAGVSGAFANVTSNSAFLAPSLSYDSNNVFLTLTRNGTTFTERGATPNQQQAAAAAEALKCGNALYDPLAGLSPEAARAAFGQISGEIHATARGALLDDSRFLRGAMLRRRPDGRGIWAFGYGTFGEIDGNGNAAGVDRDSAGLFAGLDLPIGAGRSAGLGGGYSRAHFSSSNGGSEADVASLHLAARIGGRWGRFGLAIGAAVSWHHIDTDRRIAFTGFTDAPSAGYDGRTAQMFAEVGYEAPIGGSASVEPFLDAAWVDVETAAFAETGGAAALTGSKQSDGTGFTTLGLRAEKRLGAVALTGTAGWRHAFSLEPSEARLSFAGGAPFIVAGAPIARDALIVEAGVEIGLGGSGRLGIAYSGQLAGRTEDHGARAVLSLPF